MLTFKEYLLEYLTDEQRKRYKNIQMTPEARKHTDHYFGNGNDQVREDIPGLEQDKSEIHKAVERHLGVSISHDHYRAGRFTNEKGNQVRIGKVIKDKALLKQFNEDNTRSGGKKLLSGHYATIVRGTEVAGQTNSATDASHPKGHSWADQSCKNVDSGSNRNYLVNEIKHGTVVYRVHDHTGQEIYRATLHPHFTTNKNFFSKFSKNAPIYTVNSEYGLKHPTFQKHAQEIARKLSSKASKHDIFSIHPSVYNDSNQNLALHPELSHEHVTKALENEDPKIKVAALHHPNASHEHITKALDDKNESVRLAALHHPNASHEHITKALDDKSEYVREAAMFNSNASHEHIAKALDDKNKYVRRAAIKHPNVTKDHVIKALNDEDPLISSIAKSKLESL